MALIVALVGTLGLALRGPRTEAPESAVHSDAQHLVAILQYLGADYPAAVASKDASELVEQRSLSAEAAGL
ncbi:MAG: hypothetical protein M3O46_22175, partial [Myxococcota bacterium]|nr:hypothetical protein [Myxococcota bacterium]